MIVGKLLHYFGEDYPPPNFLSMEEIAGSEFSPIPKIIISEEELSPIHLSVSIGL